MTDCSCGRLLEESKLITKILETSCSKESLVHMDKYVADFKKDLIEAFCCNLKTNNFDEVDKLVVAYHNYKVYLSKRNKR